MTIHMRNIYQRLNQVMAEVEAIQIAEVSACGNGGFLPQNPFVKALHAQMIKAGIAMIPDIRELTQNGLRAVVKITISFVNIDDPQDRIQVNSMGYGIDPYDSGVGKAVSCAVKYAQLMLFCNENFNEAKPVTVNSVYKPQKMETVSGEQLEEILRLASLKPKKFEKILELLKVEEASQIPANCYDRVLAAFKRYEAR